MAKNYHWQLPDNEVLKIPIKAAEHIQAGIETDKLLIEFQKKKIELLVAELAAKEEELFRLKKQAKE